MHRYSHWNVGLWRRKIDQFTHNGKFLSSGPGQSKIYWDERDVRKLWETLTFLQFSLIGSLALQLTANNGAFACRLTGIVQVLSSSSKRLSRVSLFGFWRDVTWRVQTGLGLGIVFPACLVVSLSTNIQLSPQREREHTIAMCVYKQSYECLSLQSWSSIEMVSSPQHAGMERQSHSSSNCHFYHIPPPAPSFHWPGQAKAKSVISSPGRETLAQWYV